MVYGDFAATPQDRWTLLSKGLWLKHENRTPIGVVKSRGGLHHRRVRSTSAEKRAAMRKLGLPLLEHSEDFQKTRAYAMALAAACGADRVMTFHLIWVTTWTRAS